MPQHELKCYFRWFQDALPKREHELVLLVRQTPGFEEWQADFTPKSLDMLGVWFAEVVRTRERSPDEIAAIADALKFPVDIAVTQLTDQTYSIAMDVGMYFGRVLLRQHAHLRWDQPRDNKRFVDYGHVVISGQSKVVLNPVRMAVVLAQGLATKKQSGRRLRELYEVWSGLLSSRREST